MKLNYIKVFVPLLVVLLGVFVYVSKQDKKPGDKVVPLAERYHLTGPSVALIEYTTEKGTMRAAKDGERWQMSQPGTYPADGIEVAKFVDSLLAIQPDRILADLPSDKLAEYGLDQPTATIQFSDEKQVLLNLKIGGLTASGSSYYAQAENDGAVLTLPIVPMDEQVLKYEPNSFRSKKVFQIDRENLAKIEVSYPTENRGYTLEKQPEGWQITAPFNYRAKERLIDATLIHFEDLEVDKFLPTLREQSAMDPSMGLGMPDSIVTLTNADGTTQQLSIGAPGGDLGALYASSPAMPEVFLAQQHIADKVKWSDAEIREDRLVVFASDTIATIEVRLRGADNLTIEKGPDGTWSRTQPTTLAFGADEITPLIAALVQLAPQEYVPESEAVNLDETDVGFSEYTFKLELKKADTFKSQLLTIGKLHRRRGYFTRDSLSEGIYLLPEEQVKELDKQIEKIRGGDKPKDEQEAWSAEQKAQLEANAEQAAADAKKAKKDAKKKQQLGKQKEANGTGIR